MKTSLSTHGKTLRMVQIALLMALEVVLTLLYIPVGTINLNFGLVPIVISAIFLCPAVGALIGGVSGVVTAVQVVTVPGIFNTFLVTVNPIAACVISVIKTAVAGLMVGWIYSLMSKLCKSTIVNSFVAAAVCPIVNSGIFAIGMFAFFGDALLADAAFSTRGSSLIAIVFLGLIGVNFIIEFIVTSLISPALCKTITAAKIFSK